MFYLKKPKDFTPKMQVVICYCIFLDEILFLRRKKKKKFQGGLWTAPGGKKEKNESSRQTIIRELFEETSLRIAQDALKYIGQYYIRYPNFDFNIEIYKTFLNAKPKKINLSITEHDKYQWITPQKALDLDLIPGARDCLLTTFFDLNIAKVN